MPNSIPNLAHYLRAMGNLPDDYAALRHALALTQAFSVIAPAEGLVLPLHTGTLERLTLEEYAWGRLARQGAVAVQSLATDLTHKELAALLRGLVRNRAAIEATWLLAQLGRSDTLNALVQDALVLQSELGMLPPDFTAHLRSTFDNAERRHHSRTLVTLLDSAAEIRAPLLSADETAALLTAWNSHMPVLLALLRYAAALCLEELVEPLRARLYASSSAQPALRLALVNTLGAIGGLDCPLLDAFAEHLEREPGPTRLLRDIIAALRAPSPAPATKGLKIAQCMFLGRIGQAGKGDSGGLGVFLAALGDALAQTPGIAQVTTLVLLNGPAEDDPPLTFEHGAGHTVVHIPVYGQTLTQYQMMVQATPIRIAIEQVLRALGIEPDIFHVRYADHGSRAAVQLARKWGKQVVYTLTADPHRRLLPAFARKSIKGLEAKTLTFELTRALIADQIVALADGFVGMPTSDGPDALRAYFPQLILDPTTRAKPLELIAEGISLGEVEPPEQQQDTNLLHGMCRFESCQQGYRLDPSFEARPVMLNVGRLHPVKQQPLLVEAWVESGLWRTYNLTLIGGNMEAPTAVERAMQARIEATFSRYPEARGRFCFLPALSNAEVRRLERTLVVSLPAALPHVYVCSSVKEEFGIAVLEAMDAGLLVFGPRVGGLSSYITPGENGFLMDTSSAAEIGSALVSILQTNAIQSHQLRTIAAAGQRTVRERFDIRVTAQAFANFYHKCASL